MPAFIPILLAGALCGPARAADHELSLELGALGTADERFDLFREGALIRTWGARGGVALHENVSVLLGYHRGAWGSEVGISAEDGEGDGDDDGVDTFQAAYQGHHLLLGPKVDLRVTDWLRPYGTVQGAALIGRVLLDDDPDHDDNENQLSATSVNPGGVVALGVDVVPIRKRQALRFGSHLEMGYGLMAATGFTATPPGGGGEKFEIARFGFGGFYLRAGVGAYF